MKIKLYCPKNSTGSALKFKLQSALAEHKLPYPIEEINESVEFLRGGDLSVPVIRVLDNVIIHDDKATIDDTVKRVMDELLNESIHYILVPVDFTPASLHALRYARLMASALKMGITIAHIHEPIIDTGIVGDFDGEMKKINCDKLEKMMAEVVLDQVHSGQYVPVNTHFDVGDVKSNIINLVSADKYDLIIMSTQAQDTFQKRMQGSVSTTIGRHSSKPVIVVPIEAPLKFPAKIVVGISDELMTDHVMAYVMDFANNHKVMLEFVHISNDLAEFNRLKDLLSEKIGKEKNQALEHISRVHAKSNDIGTQLVTFANNVQADMILLATHNRNLMESMGHRSITKEVLVRPPMPVMILHSRRENERPKVNLVYEAIK